MREIKAPARPLNVNPETSTVFLAGSIDMGAAVDWQAEIIKLLADQDVVIFNPRRSDWDSTWKQEMANNKFRDQVEWELEHLDKSKIIVYMFDPKGKAPITLLELGLHAARDDQKIVVCCPEGFWRRGNVEIVCHKHNIPMVNDVKAVANKVIQYIQYNKRES